MMKPEDSCTPSAPLSGTKPKERRLDILKKLRAENENKPSFQPSHAPEELIREDRER
jgi:hypothetical protein